MTNTWRNALVAAAATFLATGCSTSPPGAGLTNGEPVMLGGREKAAERDDMPTPDLTGGDESLAETAATSPGGAGNNAGTGGRNGGKGGTKAAAGTQPDRSDAAPAPRANPPKVESSGENGAQGGTRPAGNINTGTPRSPQ